MFVDMMLLFLFFFGQNACASDPRVQVSPSPLAEVVIGSSIELYCRYPGVSAENKFYIFWTFQKSETASAIPVWTYFLKKETQNMENAEKIETDITKEHAIRLRNVTLESEGLYVCKVEHYGQKYMEGTGQTMIAILVPPSTITISFEPEIVIASQEVIVSCKVAQVKPFKNLDIQLLNGTSSLQGNLVEQISNPDGLTKYVIKTFNVEFSRYDDNREFMCLANWDRQHYQNVTTVSVLYPPSYLKLSQQPSIVGANELVQVSCLRDEAKPSPDLLLKRGGQIIANSTSGSVSYLDNETGKENNLMNYTCEAVGGVIQGVMKAEQPLSVSIQFRATTIEMTEKPSNRISEDTTAVITCITDAGNPTPQITWEHAPTGLEYLEKMSEEDIWEQSVRAFKKRSSFEITTDRRLHKQRYTCGLIGLPAMFDEVTLDIKFQPLNIDPSNNMPVPEGKEIVLGCTAQTSNPPVTFQWKIDNEDLSAEFIQSDVSDGTFNGTRVFSQVTMPGDKGRNGQTVVCTPFFDGKDLKELARTFILNVSYPPTVRITTNNEDLIEGDELFLECVAEQGNPEKYDYTWMHKEMYEDNYADIMNKTARTLQIQNVKHFDAGWYSCDASNSGGKTTAEKFIRVQYAPFEVDSKENNIVFSPLSVSVLLNLTVQAVPRPTVNSWQFMGSDKAQEDMDPSDSTIIPRGNDTFVYQLRVVTSENAYGTYTGSVSNGVGEPLDVSFVLKPDGPPTAPYDVQVVSFSAYSVTLQWKAGLNGGHPQTFSVMQQKAGDAIYTPSKPSDPIIEEPNEAIVTHTVIDLDPEAVYEFRVISTNIKGSESAGAVSAVTLEGESAGAAGVVGGVIGAIIALLVVTAILILFVLRSKNKGPLRRKDVESNSNELVCQFELSKDVRGVENEGAYDEVTLGAQLQSTNGAIHAASERPTAESPYDEVVVRNTDQENGKKGRPIPMPRRPEPMPRKKRSTGDEPQSPNIPVDPRKSTQENPYSEVDEQRPLYQNLNYPSEDKYDYPVPQDPGSPEVLYAEVAVKPPKADGEAPVIRGQQDKTIYQKVDFSAGKPILQQDSDSD